jgi:nicotinamidase-related amidase
MSTKTVLLLIDIQLGFESPHSYWGPSRSNPFFEANAKSLLSSYRRLVAQSPSQHKIIHVAHSSTNVASPLHISSPGFAFQSIASPHVRETVITKSVNSAFIGTNLSEVLKEHYGGKAGKLYILGLTTDHCVSTTTRMAGNLGVTDGNDGNGEVILIEDATAAWKKGEGDKWSEAELVHAVHVESLREFASVAKTSDLLKDWAT